MLFYSSKCFIPDSLPCEFLELDCGDSQEIRDGEEVSIEPHIDSPENGEWPVPITSRVVNNRVRIPNDSDSLIKVSKSQHVAVIRRLVTPEQVVAEEITSPVQMKQTKPVTTELHSSLVSLDPSNQLTSEERNAFSSLHQQYDVVFDPKIGVYNDYSGPVRAHVNIGPLKPPPRKTKIPSYNTETLQELQKEFDELEESGIIGIPEELGINVQHAFHAAQAFS